MEITQHAFDRAKERYNLNEKSFTRLAEKAFNEGHRQDYVNGKLKKYVN